MTTKRMPSHKSKTPDLIAMKKIGFATNLAEWIQAQANQTERGNFTAFVNRAMSELRDGQLIKKSVLDNTIRSHEAQMQVYDRVVKVTTKASG